MLEEGSVLRTMHGYPRLAGVLLIFIRSHHSKVSAAVSMERRTRRSVVSNRGSRKEKNLLGIQAYFSAGCKIIEREQTGLRLFPYPKHCPCGRRRLLRQLDHGRHCHQFWVCSNIGSIITSTQISCYQVLLLSQAVFTVNFTASTKLRLCRKRFIRSGLKARAFCAWVSVLPSKTKEASAAANLSSQTLFLTQLHHQLIRKDNQYFTQSVSNSDRPSDTAFLTLDPSSFFLLPAPWPTENSPTTLIFLPEDKVEMVDRMAVTSEQLLYKR